MDKYKNGKEIVYTIEEEAVADYVTVYQGYDIMNIHQPGKGGDLPPTDIVEVKPPKTGIRSDSTDEDNILMIFLVMMGLFGIRITRREW